MKKTNIIIAVAALVVGVAIGWFAAGVANSPVDDPGRARCPRCADAGGVGRVAIPDVGSSAAKPKRSAPAPSAESERKASVELSGEKPKENAGEQATGTDAKPDNPFPRYLDMFKNNPAALAAEFLKEAEADRVKQRKMRNNAIARLKLNAEQTAFFEKALDNLKSAVMQQEQEKVDLITSGQLNEDTAADGRIWSSNRLLMDQCVAARDKLVRDAAVEIYNRLDINGVPDSEIQSVIQWTTLNTSFSYECLEPYLTVYDKVYKNMGVGKGIFSWCTRLLQKK